MSNLSGNDLVYYKENGKIMSGGFDINSILMKQDISPYSSLNSNGQTGGSSVANLFKSLAVPSGLLYLHEKKRGHKPLDYFQTGGNKKANESLIKEEEESDDESTSSSNSNSSSSEDSDNDNDSDSDNDSNNKEETDSNKYVADSEVLSEDIFKKCLDIVTKMEIAKQKAQKKKNSQKCNPRKRNKPKKTI